VISATYRLQLNKNFNFGDVIDNLWYFKDLGVSHLYLSPVLMASPGSNHGYDVIDHSRINDELGGEKEYRRLIETAHTIGLGIIQDIVPNHMAVNSLNWRLMDVLKMGKKSKYYTYFDFFPEDDKIRLPILGEDLDTVISKGLLKIVKDGDEYFLEYFKWKLPLTEVGNDIYDTLQKQNYTLMSWKNPPSYRRFFDVNTLIGVNVEKDHVFQESHSKILDLDVDGYRIDHIDGLYDPEKYINDLRSIIKNKIIIVEKILGFQEELKLNSDGTTGYDFLNYSNLLFNFNQEIMDSIYENFTAEKISISESIKKIKAQIIDELFSYEVKRLASQLGISYDILRDYLSCIDVYRTYANQIVKECDKTNEIEEATKRNPEAYTKLQQYMPAVYAKAYEDTFLFRYNRLISINEVGSDLRYYKISPDQFHVFNQKRRGKITLNATSTHDTKFSEDVRMKISVLSEFPEEWKNKVEEWHSIINPKVSRNDEYRYYQVLVGSFYEGFSNDFKERIKQHMIKSVREAKINTSWRNQNKEYENRVMELVEETFTNKDFIKSFMKFESKIRRIGMIKSLSLVALKIMSAGIPDFYQGTEIWRYLLTDPDNRVPVDFKKLHEILEKSKKFEKNMLESMDDGRIKMYLTYKLLSLRKQLAEDFLKGEYKGLDLEEGLCGFIRFNKILVIIKTKGSVNYKLKLEEGAIYTDVLTGEEIKKEVQINELPRILVRM